MGYKTILTEKNLDEVIDSRKINRNLEMMNDLNVMKIAWENLVSIYSLITRPDFKKKYYFLLKSGLVIRLIYP